MTRVIDARHLYGEWRQEFDTRTIIPNRMKKMMRSTRFVFRDAFCILDGVNLNDFRAGVFNLAALAAEDFPQHQRYSENIDRAAFGLGLIRVPVWLAYAMCSVYKQEELSSPYAVIMHEPVYVPRYNANGNDQRVLALAEGEHEFIVAAPRIDSVDPWDENRTFIYMES